MALAWTLFALLLIAIFWLTHAGFEQARAKLFHLVDWFQ
jgi:hypothetical protein